MFYSNPLKPHGFPTCGCCFFKADTAIVSSGPIYGGTSMASCAMKFQLSLERHCPIQFPWSDIFHGTTLNSKKIPSRFNPMKMAQLPLTHEFPLINYIHCPCILLARNEPRTGCTKKRSSKARSTRCDAAKSYGTYHGKSPNGW